MRVRLRGVCDGLMVFGFELLLGGVVWLDLIWICVFTCYVLFVCLVLDALALVGCIGLFVCLRVLFCLFMVGLRVWYLWVDLVHFVDVV